jgi:hypothetical protein
MIARFRIGLSQPSTPDLVPQLRNFGEYLHGILSGKAHLNMKEIDAATEYFWVEVPEKRYLGEVATALKRCTSPDARESQFTMERIRS